MKKRPTQEDVAQIAGVSRGTVSLVVNRFNDSKVPISEETRQRVLVAIEELGYEPDASARALRSGDTKAIGLIIPDIRNPHYWDNVDGVEQEAQASGYRLLLSSLGPNYEYRDGIFRDLLSQRIDGLILMGSYFDQSNLVARAMDHLHKRRLSLVEVGDRIEGEHHLDCVLADYRSATSEVIATLLSLNHRRIGLVYGVAKHELALDRLYPYQESLRAAGLPDDQDLIVHCGPLIEDGYKATDMLLRLPERPTAIITINDLLSIGAARAVADHGLRIPADLSLVGYDDVFTAKYMVPRLTTVSKDAVRIGREAFKLLLGRIQDPNRPIKIVRLPTRVIIRESTGPAPIL